MYVFWSHTRKAKTFISFLCILFLLLFNDMMSKIAVWISSVLQSKKAIFSILFLLSRPFLFPVICFLKTWKSNPAVIIKNCRHPSFHICLFLATQAETKMSLKITGTSTKNCILVVKLVVVLYQIGNSMYLHIKTKVKEDMDTLELNNNNTEVLRETRHLRCLYILCIILFE